MYLYDDVAFGVVKNLDTSRINQSFRRLYQNDREIFPAHDFMPKIWENRWFNNETIVGYPAGYCVWKNVYDEVSAFLEVYGELVYNYAQQNELLQNVIVSSWEDIKTAYIDPAGKPTAGYEIWRERYCNAISGYSKVTQTNLTKNSQITYLKIEITKCRGNSEFVEINEVSVYGDTTFNFSGFTPYFSANTHRRTGELKNIVDADPRTSCKLQTEDGNPISKNNPIVITIQLGSGFLNLKMFSNWKIKFNDSHIATDYNLYCSENGEEWAFLDQVTDLESDEHFDKFRLRNTSYRKQYLEPMFDYGPFARERIAPTTDTTTVTYDDGSEEFANVIGMLTRRTLDSVRSGAGNAPKIELYISKVNDNKSYLSDTAAWQSLVLSDENSLSAFISAEVDAIFSQHMKDYHFGGNLSRDEIDQVLLKNDMSNFDIDAVQNTINVAQHDQFINSDGFDYVVDYKRSWVSADIIESKATQLYRWYRLWNSGRLEHGGIVKCNPLPSSVQKTSDPYIFVNLKWENSNPVYNYDEVSSQNYGTQYEQLFYGRRQGSTIDQKEIINTGSGYLGKSRYSISITPTIFNQADINHTSFKYNDISCLISCSYPETTFDGNKNKPYLITEVHHIKNDSFCFTRSDTDTLDGSKVQFYQYYTIGYKADWKNYDRDLANVQVRGLNDEYKYTGEAITPNIQLINVFGYILIQNVDYKLEYSNNINIGTGTITVIGIGKYFNQLICNFKIVEKLSV